MELLLNLEQKIKRVTARHMAPEEAYKTLKELTGRDFGYDVKKWREWIHAHGLKKSASEAGATS